MNKNPERFGPRPNHNDYNPDQGDLERYTLTELSERANQDPLARVTYDKLRNKHLEELDFDELAAYRLYRERREIEADNEETVERLGGDYRGTYNSVDEFTDNWAYHMEPMEAIETLLNALGHPEKHMSLAEMALVDRLKNDMEFIFQDGQVTVFSRPPEEER